MEHDWLETLRKSDIISIHHSRKTEETTLHIIFSIDKAEQENETNCFTTTVENDA